MTIGERIKELRMIRGLTQRELAIRLGTTYQAISKYENGVVDNLPSYKLQEIAVALGTTPAYLMGWEEKEEKPIQKDELSKVKTELIELVKSLSEEECQAVLKILKR